jgi:hypothetical protein
VKNPRIVTHLFADGGRIIKTARTEYAEHVTRADMQVYVRSLMKEQHKGMFTALRLGELDTLLENVCGPFEQPPQASKAPPPVMTAPPPSEAFVEPLITQPAPAPSVEAESPAPSSPFSADERPSETARRRKRALSNPNLRKVTPSVPPPNAAAFELDVAALERLPAPPAAPPRPDRTPEPPSARPLRKSAPAPARKSRPSPAQPPSSKAGPPPSLSRPSSRFAAGPSKSAQSIFGDGVISEQSLDEVILSYLAEDLDGSSE